MARVQTMYFCYFMAIGAFLPFINLYYERIGLTGVQIGTLSALPLFVMSTTSIFWGALADALNLQRRLLSVSLLLAPFPAFALSQTSQYSALIPLVLAYALFSAPVLSLLDSSALEAATTHHRTYGEVRVWGTIGWATSTWLVGTLIERLDTRWLFYSYAFFMALVLIASFFQPPRRQVLESPLRHGLFRLVAHRVFVLFLMSIFLLTVTMGAVNYFFSLYLDGIGAGEGTIGLAWALAAMSEVPLMIYSGSIIRRIGAAGLLSVAFITFALRWLLYSFIENPGLAVLVQLLHGLSFGAFLVGAVTYVNDRTPQGMSTTAQAILGTVSFGIGPIVGAMVGGYFYDTVGLLALFRILSFVAVIALLVFWLANRATRVEGMPSASGNLGP